MNSIHEKYQLPEGWIWTTLDELGIVASGGTPSTANPQFWEGEIPWITPADLSGYQGKYVSRGRRNITQLGLINSSASLLPKGSLIFSSRAPIGYVAIAQNTLTTNQGFKNLIPTESSFTDYLYYYLHSAKQIAIDMASGTTFLELSGSNFRRIPVPLAPIEEQKRIVLKIEELLSEVNEAKKSLLKAQRQLKIYREVILQKIFSNTEKKWETGTFDSICYKIQDGSHFSPKDQFSEKGENRYLYITSKNIRNDYMDLSDVTYVNKSFHDSIYPRCNPEYGDILLTKDGANTGNVTINTLREPFSMLSSVCLLKPDTSKVTALFLKYFIQSPTGFKKLAGEMTGTAIKRIVLQRIKQTELRYPSLDLQEKIVQEIERKFAINENLFKTINQNLKKLESYRLSIFNKAFTGNLVKQEKSDESAEKMLHRIGVEKIKYLNTQKALQRPKRNISMTENKTIIEILKEAGKAVSSREVWLNSIYKTDIDKFYEILKKHIENGDIIEKIPRKGRESLLSLNNAK